MNRIKQLREEKNITQQELANKINGAKSTIAMYEKGTRKPSMQILIKLSDIFDCSIDYLLGKSDVRKPEIQNEDLLDLAKVGFTKENYKPPSLYALITDFLNNFITTFSYHLQLLHINSTISFSIHYSSYKIFRSFCIKNIFLFISYSGYYTKVAKSYTKFVEFWFCKMII